MKVAYKVSLPLVIVVTVLIWFVTDTFNNTQLHIVKDTQEKTALKITEQFEKNKQNVLRNLQKNIEFSSNMIVEVSSKYLYDFDFDALKAPLAKFLEDKNIKGIEIFEKTQNSIVFSLGEKNKSFKIIKKDIVWENGEVLGYAKIHYDDRHVTYYFQFSKQELLEQIKENNKQQDQFIDKILTQRTYVNFSITIVVLLILLFTVYLVILKPLRKLESGLGSFFNYLQHKSDNVKKIELHSNDEFGKMGQTLNENIAVTTKLHEEIHQLNQNLEEKVLERTDQLNKKTEQIAQLLDNAKEGFLSFGEDLFVDSEYSKECELIFQKPIEKENIASLFFKKECEDKELFVKVMGDVFDPKIKSKRKQVLLHLLPKEFVVFNNHIQVEYKIISPKKLMLILIDITEKKKLEEKVELEKQTLKMVVSVVRDIKEFREIIQEFKEFALSKEKFISDEKTFFNSMVEFYRIIHTYKGNFAQKDLLYIVPKLHSYESEINNLLKNPNRSFEEFKGLIENTNLDEWVNEDIEVIESILEQDILKDENTVSVAKNLIDKIEDDIKQILNFPKDKRDVTYEDLFDDVINMRKTTLKEFFKSYPRYVEKLAQKLEKNIYPLKVVGGEDIYVSDNIHPFVKTLVHIFRNSIDHGIESLEERVATNKDEKATISCNIEKENENVVITIVDDGKGVDTKVIKQKALEKGLYSEDEISKMNRDEILNIIFLDSFSVKEEVTELSGRGVGLAAVKSELVKLDGTLAVDSTLSKGTTFKFTIPLKAII